MVATDLGKEAPGGEMLPGNFFDDGYIGLMLFGCKAHQGEIDGYGMLWWWQPEIATFGTRNQRTKLVPCLTSHHLSLPGKGGGKMPSPYDFMCLGAVTSGAAVARACWGIIAIFRINYCSHWLNR